MRAINFGVPGRPRNVGKKVRPACAICGPVERNFAWLVTAARAVLQGSGPLSPAEVRAYRRQFERQVVARPDDPHRTRRLWQLELAGRPELRVAGHRPPVPMSGLILYVLAGVVARLLEHDAELTERATHFADDTVVNEIVRLGREALTPRQRTRRDLGQRGLEIRVLARLLGLEEKLVRIRLRPAELCAEIAAARARGWVDWVSLQQLLWAARYRQDATMLNELRWSRGAPSTGEEPAGSSMSRGRCGTRADLFALRVGAPRARR